MPTAAMVANSVLVGELPTVVEAGMDSAAARRALRALAVVAALSLLAYVTEVAGALLRENFARVASRRWDLELMSAMAAPATVSHLEDPAVLDRIENASGRTRAGPIQAVAAIGPVVTMYVGAALSLVVVAAFSPWLALLYLLFSVAVRRHGRTRYRRITAAVFNQGNLHRRSAYMRALALTPPAAKELRVFGLADWVRSRFDREWQDAMASVFDRMRAGWPLQAVLFLATQTLIVIGTWHIAVSAVEGSISLATAALTLQALMHLDGLHTFSDSDQMVTEGAERIPAHHEIVAELRSLADQQRPRAPRALPPNAPENSIVFEAVTFAYPGTDAYVLRDFDLRIEAGSSVAIVGVNGAGKTTMVKLLAGLQRPTTGRITVDGIPLEELDPTRWHRRVSAIFQDFWHYPLSVRANVGFGAPDRLQDEDALERAAHRAGAADLINALPRGWDTSLDRQFDDGVDLSGGQWQRIALARALFAVEAGARLLVLDEPTAALDVRAEADIYNRFLDITHGLTSIVISHRFSTVRRAQRIVVLDGGVIIEDGSHDALVAAGGRYAQMFELQAARYRDEAGTSV